MNDNGLIEYKVARLFVVRNELESRSDDVGMRPKCGLIASIDAEVNGSLYSGHGEVLVDECEVSDVLWDTACEIIRLRLLGHSSPVGSMKSIAVDLYGLFSDACDGSEQGFQYFMGAIEVALLNIGRQVDAFGSQSPFAKDGVGFGGLLQSWGGSLNYKHMLSSAVRAAWLPHGPEEAASSELKPHRYEIEHFSGLSSVEIDSCMLERHVLSSGVSTVRISPHAFVFESKQGRSGFWWTRSTISTWPAVGLTADKETTNALLRERGVPVPLSRRFKEKDYAGALAFSEEINWPVVVKPLRGTGGTGVITNIESSSELRRAIEALRDTPWASEDFVIEKHMRGPTYRVFVLDDEVLGFVRYAPGVIVGDGRHSVAELMLARQGLRRRNPHLMNRLLSIDEGELFLLEKQGVTPETILAENQEVVFTVNPNFGQGGESEDVLEEVHPSLLQVCVQAMRAIPGLRFAGLDFIVEDHRLPADSQVCGFCEVNANPAIGSAEFPLYGVPRSISRRLAHAAIGRSDVKTDDLHVELTIDALSIGPDYQEWVKDKAAQLNLVVNIKPVSTERAWAEVRGAADRVAAMISHAFSGSGTTKVKSIQSYPVVSPLEIDVGSSGGGR